MFGIFRGRAEELKGKRIARSARSSWTWTTTPDAAGSMNKTRRQENSPSDRVLFLATTIDS
jgi:hypothetical protein